MSCPFLCFSQRIFIQIDSFLFPAANNVIVGTGPNLFMPSNTEEPLCCWGQTVTKVHLRASGWT